LIPSENKALSVRFRPGLRTLTAPGSEIPELGQGDAVARSPEIKGVTMKRNRLAIVFVVLLSLPWALAAQVPSETPQSSDERYRYIQPGTVVSDDPRRVPMPPQPAAEGALVLRGGRVFDAVDLQVREQTVVIVGREIQSLLPPSSTAFPTDAEIVDISGHTVLPGLIDLHTHLDYSDPQSPAFPPLSKAEATLRAVERLRFYLESGVTAVRDVASGGEIPFVLKRWVAQNRVLGPRIFAAGQLITGTGGHGAEGGSLLGDGDGAVMTASGPHEWREAVRKQFDRGADVIKLASHFTREEVRAAIDEAHQLGLKVTVDAETFYIRTAVEEGVDCVEHPLPRSDEAIRLMAEKGVASVPTLVPYIIILDQNGGYWGSTSRRFTMTKESNLEMLSKLRSAGVKLGVGTDLVADWYRYLPEPYLVELEQFMAVGYDAAEALVAATRTSAEILDMGHRLGTIEAGKLADVVVVAGRPDETIRDLANVELVVRDGKIVVRGGRLAVERHQPQTPPGSE